MCGTNAADYMALQEALVRILVIMASILVAKAMLFAASPAAALRKSTVI